jgi:DNA-directed RNA polymerase specialized sigma24 family protein
LQDVGAVQVDIPNIILKKNTINIKLISKKNLDIVLKNILPGLTDEDILVWKKRYLDDLNPQEVGILIGKSPGAVRIRASRVNKAIRAHFKELK